jgi:very-short-patch-repair endonuclease
MAQLAQAIEDRDPARWSAAWHTRASLTTAGDRFHRYQELLDRIRGACPELAELLRSTQGDPEWKDRPRQLEKAWAWAAANAWLRKVTDPERYERLAEERQRLQGRIEKRLEALAALKAWQAFFVRLDDPAEQNLTAWTKAVARIGKGTGKYAYRHRRTARQYLMACIPKMPAWILPLHKLWETTDPTPGAFDTVIVDESSQAGIDALALLLLAKRIIVVGDDKQNSPEAVGVLEPRVREERKLRCGVPATFQGDQRDVIVLSLVVAPNHNFRALTGLPDQRRFNVAMSRARDQVWLFHSVQAHDLSREDLRWRLLHFFSSPAQLDAVYEELDRLEREALRRSREPGSQPDPYESWFEADVAVELLRKKYRVRPQYEVAGYRIDLVVEGLLRRIAVECDGEAWHGPERFEHDAARQRQLERAGWTFVRLRESEFYADRNRAVRRIVEACEELGIRPLGEEELEIESEEPTTSASAREARLVEDREEEEQDERQEAEEEVNDEIVNDEIGEELRAAPLGEYSQESGFPDPRDASPTNVRAALRRIIEREGPLTKRLLIRVYVEGCPTLHRAGRTVRSLLNRALYSMQKAGEIVAEDELDDRSLESQVLRLAGAPRVRERPAGRRDLLEITPSELFLVLDRLSGPSTGSAQNDEALTRALLEHFGFSRLTEVRRRHLAKILNSYRQRRRC